MNVENTRLSFTKQHDALRGAADLALIIGDYETGKTARTAGATHVA